MQVVASAVFLINQSRLSAPGGFTIKTNTMMTVKIGAYQAGLLFRNNRYIKQLGEGRYWLLPGEKVYTYDLTKQFIPPVDLNILLQDPALAEALIVVEVRNNEIALQYENGLFKWVLPPGRYAFWKGIVQYSFIKADLNKIEVTEPIERAVLARQEVSAFVRVYIVESYERGLLFVEGVFVRMLEPGVYHFWKNNIVITVYKIDSRQLQMELNGQEILTRDKAMLRINFSVQYKVVDIFRASANKEYDKQLYVIMQLALREQVAVYTLDELLDRRDAVSPLVLEAVKEKAAALGVEVLGCGIRDIILPGDVKDIMNQVLIAEKKAQANIIMRREETASTRSLLNTAKLMEENDMLFRLKEMEYVEKIADKISNLSVSGSGDLVGQLKQIFVPPRAGKT
jgi:regulator of protease activity HflC (stomatin/prohibitin superfamily)